MHILLSCLQSRVRHPVPAYKYWEQYFVGGIEEGGHTWEAIPEVDWAEGLLYAADPAGARAWRERTWGAVLRALRDPARGARPDLFLAYLYPWMVEPSAIREIQGKGIPCVNYFCDNVRQFTSAPPEYRVFDLNWVPELAATKFYARDGVRFIHAAMPTWIPPEQRSWDHAERYPATFIGTRDPQRERLFAELFARGGEVELRGNSWPLAPRYRSGAAAPPASAVRRTRPPGVLGRQIEFVREYGLVGMARKLAERRRRPVEDALLVEHVRPAPDAAEYVAITQGSVVVIGVNRYPSYRFPFDHPDTYSRGRDVEAPMMGACYLTEWTPELETMYRLGEEIETYRTAEEMIEKIRMLEADPARRKRMRRLAQERALKEHSVPRSLERIGERLGIPTRDRAAR